MQLDNFGHVHSEMNVLQFHSTLTYLFLRENNKIEGFLKIYFWNKAW